jgi:hypothetical protein
LLTAAAFKLALEGEREDAWAFGDDVVDGDGAGKESIEKAAEDLPFV